jgi:hypothetical protein
MNFRKPPSFTCVPLADGEFDEDDVVELTKADLVDEDFFRAPTVVQEELQSADTVVREVDPFTLAAIRNDALAGTVHISTFLDFQDWLDGLSEIESQAA